MKYIVIFLMFMMMSFAAKAQETNVSKRNISLLILDKKERPIERIIVRSLNNTNAGMTDRKGRFVFADLTDNDRISLLLPKYGETIIPVAGMDSIVVKLRSARRYSYISNAGRDVFVNKPNKTEPTTILDVQALLEQNAYKSVAELLQGQVPGLNITPATTSRSDASFSVRGPNTLLGSNEPLFVVDGMAGVSINDINVNDVKTIEVQKGGSSEWGIRGANGVILITTR